MSAMTPRSDGTRREAVAPNAFIEAAQVRRHGPLVVCWFDLRHWWFRLFGYGLVVKSKDEWRVFSCRNGMGWHRYHVEIGPVLVCPLRRRGV